MTKLWLLCGAILLVVSTSSCKHVPARETNEDWPQQHGRNPAAPDPETQK